MRVTVVTLVLAGSLAVGSAYAAGQAGAALGEPFKLGTFERGGQVFVGLVLRDTQVVDVAQANAALERRDPARPKLRMAGNMNELIARYETELKERLYAIANDAAATQTTPQYVYAVKDLKVLPPVRPAVILNAGGNYTEHTEGIAQQQQRAGGAAPAAAPTAVTAPGIWERKPGDPRPENPYLFLKSPTVVVGAYDPIRVPRGAIKSISSASSTP